MSRRRMLWHLFPPYLLITIIAVVVLIWYAANEQGSFYLRQVASDLEVRAELIGRVIDDPLRANDYDAIDRVCKKLGRETSTRVTVMLPSGDVIGESDENPETMDSHGGRPEMVAALAGETGSSTRHSNTLQQTMMYVAVPLKTDGMVVAVVRSSVPLTFIAETKKSIAARIAYGGLAVVVLAAVVSLLVARRISRPLEDLRQGASRFAGGELTGRISVHGSEEIGVLAATMNDMASQLDNRISTVISQRNEREAILSSMGEGLLAVDRDERIITINNAAAQLFGVEPESVTHRILHDSLRNSALQRLIGDILAGKDTLEAEIVIPGVRECYLLASGSILTDSDGSAVGAVVVLNDVTRLRQLETIRRDFVANVSHELRTPITSIKGFAETLRETDDMEPHDAEEFLSIIVKQADRLNQIIDDLLSLSQLEQAPDIEFLESGLAETIESAVQECSVSASGKAIALSVKCDPDLRVRMNRQLIEQALVNLIDNAVKYSDSGSEVVLRVEQSEGTVLINVADSGCGIDNVHFDRLFERFYRVDKARSREEGGTGLGLAIVKHIVLAHSGQVTVKSTPGDGSTFTICLPANC